MMVICDCGKEFLTECDAHVVIPSQNYKLNCGCYFVREINSCKSGKYASIQNGVTITGDKNAVRAVTAKLLLVDNSRVRRELKFLKIKQALEFYAVRGLADIVSGQTIDSKIMETFYISGSYARSVLDELDD